MNKNEKTRKSRAGLLLIASPRFKNLSGPQRGTYHERKLKAVEDIKASLDGVTDLKIDFSGVEYISSAGLRVLLSCQKIMNSQGSMVMTGVRESVMEIFEVTGFSDILTIG